MSRSRRELLRGAWLKPNPERSPVVAQAAPLKAAPAIRTGPPRLSAERPGDESPPPWVVAATPSAETDR